MTASALAPRVLTATFLPIRSSALSMPESFLTSNEEFTSSSEP